MRRQPLPPGDREPIALAPALGLAGLGHFDQAQFQRRRQIGFVEVFPVC